MPAYIEQIIQGYAPESSFWFGNIQVRFCLTVKYTAIYVYGFNDSWTSLTGQHDGQYNHVNLYISIPHQVT